jgi:hypothetical protein
MKTIMVTGVRGLVGHAVEQVVRDEPRAGYRFEFIAIEEWIPDDEPDLDWFNLSRNP